MYTDLPLDQLRDYRPEVSEPDDFDAFWERTLRDSRRAGGDSTSVPADTPVTSLRIEDVTFPGFGGDPVRAWFVRPHGDEPMPCVVELVGYGGGRGLPEEHLAWASAGFAHLVMDTRGQGSVWGGGGQTPDPHPTGPAVPGVMTRGIEDPESYYYRRLVTDAVRAVDHVLSRPDVLHDQVAVHGESQGGGLALAAGALHTSVSAVLADVPFLCHFARAVTITDDGPYHEIVRYLAVHREAQEQVFRTLSYVDGVSMAGRITAPALVSVALMDPVCPPSTVFAAANRIAGAVDLEVYPFNRHEGGGLAHWRRAVRWLRETWGIESQRG